MGKVTRKAYDRAMKTKHITRKVGKWVGIAIAVIGTLIGLWCSGLIVLLAWEQGTGAFVLVLYLAVLAGLYYVYTDTKANAVLEQAKDHGIEGDKE